MPLRLSDVPARPAFMEEKTITGAERGTVMHRVLSLMPLAAVRQADRLDDAIWQEIARMEEKGQLNREEADVVSIRSIRQYFESKLGRRMLQSSNVRREWSFNLRMKDTNTLLQGVIDCVFEEDGQWVLVDYKTDWIESEEAFVERYTLQLQWYAKALAAITGKPVKEAWLYALRKGKAYAVTMEGDVSRETT